MEFVMSLCTRILVLAEGRIIAEGTPDEVRGNPAVSSRPILDGLTSSRSKTSSPATAS